jgi:hypothetical protein
MIADAGVIPLVSTLSKALSQKNGDVGNVFLGRWIRRGRFFYSSRGKGRIMR